METLPATPKIRDVALLAGVGVATVSRVLNGRAHVAEPTRERVLAAIHELGYRPSSVARNLSLGRTRVVGVVVPFFTSPSAVERVRGVVDVLSQSPYDLSLFDVEAPDRQRRAFELLGRADRADGLLVVSLVPPAPAVELIEHARIPCVIVDAFHPRLPHLVVDDVAGGTMATKHLLDLGHERIAFIGDKPPDEYRFHSSRDRTIGFERALAAAGLSAPEGYVREGTPSRHVARSIAAELLTRPDRPTAIFAASDTQALGVLEAARDLGLDVPRDVSVVGFDDVEIASYAGLTTVRQPLFESGRRGAELLLSALDGQALPAQRETMPLELVVRATTGPPRR